MAKRGRPPVRVIISPRERTTLEQWARRRTTAQGLAQRAHHSRMCGRALDGDNRARAADYAADGGPVATAVRAEAARRPGG